MKVLSFLEGKVAGVFSEKDLEQQDKFQGLATDVLKRSVDELNKHQTCLLYTSPSPRDRTRSRMPSSA